MSDFNLEEHEYETMTTNLDQIMEIIKSEKGLNEEQAQDWLDQFIHRHYFSVWRPINAKSGNEGS